MKGGLLGYLYGAEYDPVGGEGGVLDKAVQEARPYLSIVNLAGRVLSGTIFTRFVPFITSVSNFIHLSINRRSRRLLVEKLNKAAGLNNVIKEFHIWKDVSPMNLLYTHNKEKGNNPNFQYINNYETENNNLRDKFKLPENLSFNSSIITEPVQQKEEINETGENKGGRRNKKKSKKSKRTKRRRTRRHYR